MAMSRGQMKQQVSNPPSKAPKGLVYYKKGGKVSAKSKGKSKKGEAVAKGCGAVMADRRKSTKGVVRQF